MNGESLTSTNKTNVKIVKDTRVVTENNNSFRIRTSRSASHEKKDKTIKKQKDENADGNGIVKEEKLGKQDKKSNAKKKKSLKKDDGKHHKEDTKNSDNITNP